MSKQKLNLSTIIELQEIDDNVAENLTGGAFAITSGPFIDQIDIQGTSATVNLRGATELGLVNTNPGSSNPRQAGHNFRVNYLNDAGTVIGQEDVQYGRGVLRFDEFLNQGAVTALVAQETEPTSVQDTICFC